MEIIIKKWRLEPRTSMDVRTIAFLFSTDVPDISEKIAIVSLSGSLMTQVGEYITANQTSEDFKLQFGRLAAALLKRELDINKELIYSSELKFGYTTHTFPYGSINIPEIDTPQDWAFKV